jgi:hypothetical protein
VRSASGFGEERAGEDDVLKLLKAPEVFVDSGGGGIEDVLTVGEVTVFVRLKKALVSPTRVETDKR